MAVQQSTLHLDYFFQTLGGQLLYNNPINAFLIIIGLWKLRELKFLDKTALCFVLLNGLPIILVVSGMALFNPMLPHWSGPGFMILSFVAAAYMDEWMAIRYGTDLTKPGATRLPLVLKSSIALLCAALVAATLMIRYYPGTIGSHEKNQYGDGDFTLDMYGWRQLGKEFKGWMDSEKQNHALPENIKIVSHKWFPAAHLEYYVASPLHMTLVGVGDVVDLHQYYWLNKNRPALMKGDSALCIIPSNYLANLDETYLLHFTSAERIHTFEGTRGGEVARYFYVYLLKDYLGNDEASTMLSLTGYK